MYSQRGNTLFPTWEHLIPNVGTSRSQAGNIYRATNNPGSINNPIFATNKHGLLILQALLLTITIHLLSNCSRIFIQNCLQTLVECLWKLNGKFVET